MKVLGIGQDRDGVGPVRGVGARQRDGIGAALLERLADIQRLQPRELVDTAMAEMALQVQSGTHSTVLRGSFTRA